MLRVATCFRLCRWYHDFSGCSDASLRLCAWWCIWAMLRRAQQMIYAYFWLLFHLITPSSWGHIYWGLSDGLIMPFFDYFSSYCVVFTQFSFSFTMPLRCALLPCMYCHWGFDACHWLRLYLHYAIGWFYSAAAAFFSFHFYASLFTVLFCLSFHIAFVCFDFFRHAIWYVHYCRLCKNIFIFRMPLNTLLLFRRPYFSFSSSISEAFFFASFREMYYFFSIISATVFLLLIDFQPLFRWLSCFLHIAPELISFFVDYAPLRHFRHTLASLADFRFRFRLFSRCFWLLLLL